MAKGLQEIRTMLTSAREKGKERKGREERGGEGRGGAHGAILPLSSLRSPLPICLCLANFSPVRHPHGAFLSHLQWCSLWSSVYGDGCHFSDLKKLFQWESLIVSFCQSRKDVFFYVSTWVRQSGALRALCWGTPWFLFFHSVPLRGRRGGSTEKPSLASARRVLPLTEFLPPCLFFSLLHPLRH